MEFNNFLISDSVEIKSNQHPDHTPSPPRRHCRPSESIGHLDTHTLYIYNQRIRRLSDLTHGGVSVIYSIFFYLFVFFLEWFLEQ